MPDATVNSPSPHHLIFTRWPGPPSAIYNFSQVLAVADEVFSIMDGNAYAERQLMGASILRLWSYWNLITNKMLEKQGVRGYAAWY